MTSELSAQDLFVLDNTLRKHKTLPIVGAHGFLTAAASSHEQRDIDELLPFIFGGELPPILDDQKESLRNLLNGLYQDIQRQLSEDIQNFSPLDFLKKADEVEQEAQDKALRMWCIGYLQGTRLDVEYWNDTQGKSIDRYFYPMILLAGDIEKIASGVQGATQEEITTAQEKARGDLLSSIVAIYRITH